MKTQDFSLDLELKDLGLKIRLGYYIVATWLNPITYFYGESYMREFTSEHITSLKSNEIFVFGSNLEGIHGGGAAMMASRKFGAVYGEGVGFHGQSYAIPTMHGGPLHIAPYVNDFIKFAKEHPELKFYVTRIGCGIAGYDDDEIGPLFKDAVDLENVVLPKTFFDAINAIKTI